MTIVIEDLVKIYEIGDIRVQALRGFSLQIEDGEFVAIMGPSGSGKTTLLNILGGIDRPTAGKVTINGIEVGKLDKKEIDDFRLRDIGYIFQTLNLISSLTAKENIKLPMIALKMDDDLCNARAEELLEIVGLESRANHLPEQLSGGERQRIAIAMALSNNPQVILADEPTGDLDSENAKVVAEYLRKCTNELGKTVIMVTHDPMIARFADRICRISDGRVLAVHKTHDIIEMDATAFASFLRKRLDDINEGILSLMQQMNENNPNVQRIIQQYNRLIEKRSVLAEELQILGE